MNLASENHATDPVGSIASGVTVEWDHSVAGLDVDRALFVFTDTSSNTQTQIEIQRAIHTCLPLRAGVYRIAAYAKGLETYRGVVELRNGGNPTRLSPKFVAATAPKKTIDTVLKRLQIGGFVETPDLDVPRNTRVVLDSTSPQQNKLWHSVKITDVAAAKRVFGNPDHLFPGNVPRYAVSASMQSYSREALLQSAAQEYVAGHSGIAKEWEREINSVVFDEALNLSAFLLGVVTIEAGGVLEVGTKSNILICRLLRMHVTATLLVRGLGPVVIEPLAIETFC